MEHSGSTRSRLIVGGTMPLPRANVAGGDA
jgi:hypothetical protein